MNSHLPHPLLSKPTQGSSQAGEGGQQLRVEGKTEGSVVLHETLHADSQGGYIQPSQKTPKEKEAAQNPGHSEAVPTSGFSLFGSTEHST